MILITERDKIRGVADAWDKQYTGWQHDAQKMAIGRELRKLDKETATAADVERIIGNDSWTQQECDECKQAVKAVVQVGDEPYYESNTVLLCVHCIGKAAELAHNARS